MKIQECRFLTTDDRYDLEFNNWSRTYEYPVVLDVIDSIGINSPLMHNTACGPAPIHKKFMDSLNLRGSCVHSDIERGPHWVQYDITKPSDTYINKFDIVLNVSVIEHLDKEQQRLAFSTLLDQVVEGGHFIATFDYPRVDLSLIHEIFKCGTIIKPDNILNGANSSIKNHRYSHLNIVLLVVQK